MATDAALLDLDVILTPPAERGRFSVPAAASQAHSNAGGGVVRWIFGLSWAGTLLVVALEWGSPHFRDALLACLGS